MKAKRLTKQRGSSCHLTPTLRSCDSDHYYVQKLPASSTCHTAVPGVLPLEQPTLTRSASTTYLPLVLPAMAPHPHAAKKQYHGSPALANSQSPITAFFHPSPLLTPQSSSPSPHFHNAACPTSTKLQISTPTQPSLPASVQSNLLSVGMRVRKSVPEGYKTGDYSAFTLFSEHSTPPLTPDRSFAQSPSIRQHCAPKELAPFCGIMKTGGFGIQEFSPPAEHEVPSLSSQGSTISDVSMDGVDSAPPTGNKRRLLEDDDADEHHTGFLSTGRAPRFRSCLEDDISPLTIVPKESWQAGRAMMVPKSRRRGLGLVSKKEVGGQENVTDEFGEAEFLDYGLLQEVEMLDG